MLFDTAGQKQNEFLGILWLRSAVSLAPVVRGDGAELFLLPAFENKPFQHVCIYDLLKAGSLVLLPSQNVFLSIYRTNG